MAKIHIEKPHTMAVDEVRTKIDGMMGKMKSMGVDTEWQGDTLKVKGKGVKGDVVVSTSQVKVELDLGLPASLMKAKIEEKIREGLDRGLQSPQVG